MLLSARRFFFFSALLLLFYLKRALAALRVLSGCALVMVCCDAASPVVCLTFFFFLSSSVSQILSEVLHANEVYAAEFAKTKNGELALPPARHFAILTCMDARLDPAKYAGLSEGDAHVIRNAGGRATDDAIRSLVISTRLLGTREWFVIHHTDCGMLLFNDDVMSSLLGASLEPHTYPVLDTGKGPGSPAGKYIKWHTFTDAHGAVLEDVQRIAAHPLVHPSVKIYGYIYDVTTGTINPVPGATRV